MQVLEVILKAQGEYYDLARTSLPRESDVVKTAHTRSDLTI